MFDAFISYSHAADGTLAAALQQGLHRFAKPVFKLRAIRVFRDDTTLAMTPGLWPAIEKALQDSRFFILMADPVSAQSEWVEKEVGCWLGMQRADKMLIVWTGGELAWNKAGKDFDWDRTTSLPPVLAGAFKGDEPLYHDLRWAREEVQLSRKHPEFATALAKLSAAIRGRSLDEIFGEDVRQQRRTLTFLWVGIAVLLSATLFAGWQWTVAGAQRDRAETTLRAATKTANSLVYDLAREFRNRTGMPVDLVRGILDRARNLQEQLTNSGETAPDLRLSEIGALQELVTTLVAQGDTKAALDAAERSRAITNSLLAADPNNMELQRILGQSDESIGDTQFAAGRSEEALEAYRKSLTLREKLAGADPSNAQWQRNLSISYNRIGNALITTNRRDEALDAYRKGLEIREKLTASDPGNTEWQRDLSISYAGIGGALIAAGRREEALENYRNGIAVEEKLVASDPGNAQWQRDLSVSYNRIGDVLVAVGQRDGALEAYRKSIAIDEKLIASDPSNVGWQRDLLFSYNRIGDVLIDIGRRDEALDAYQKSTAIAEKLAVTDPGNVGWQRDLSISYNREGDTLLAANKSAEAIEAYQKSLVIAEKLAAADPSNTDREQDLLNSYNRIGNVLLKAGRHEDAIAAYHKSFAIGEKLAAADPSNVQWQRNVVIGLVKLAQAGDEPRARFTRALELLRQLDTQGKLAANQKNWISLIEQALAALPK